MNTNEDERDDECPYDTINKLQTKFSKASANHEVGVILTALTGLQAALLSQFPPDGRKEMARRLKKCIPVMLAQANAIAAEQSNVVLH
jgi:hypothetical protein